MKKSTLYTILSVVLANPAYADLNCVSQPSCEDLGYSKTEDCPNGKLLKCPFDTSYSKCIKASSSDVDCASLGFTTSDKSSWCGSIITCPTDTSYTACVSYEKDCSGYTLSSCPTGGNCSKCENSSGTHYKLDTCKSGYIKLSSTDTSCTKTYDSCSDAGYACTESDRNSCDGNFNYESSADIYISNVGWKTCYSDCSCSTESGSSGNYGNYDCRSTSECYECGYSGNTRACSECQSCESCIQFCDGKWDQSGYDSWEECASGCL